MATKGIFGPKTDHYYPENEMQLHEMWDSMDDDKKRGAIRHLGCATEPTADKPSLYTIGCDFYAEFMLKKGPGNVFEWARRFARGEEFHHADIENMGVLLDIMVNGTGPGNRAHIPKDMDYGKALINKFCKKHGTCTCKK